MTGLVKVVGAGQCRLALDATQVLAGQGIPRDRARPVLVEAAERMLGEVHDLATPLAAYAILPVTEFDHGRVVLEGGFEFTGSLVARAAAGASYLALAVCTIGPALDERITTLFAADDSVDALALEGAGVAAVGAVSREIGVRICDEASAMGLKVGMRAQPGQEGWAIEQQRVLFQMVPAHEIGVRLSDSCLMLPRKSVSFVLGMGPEMRPDAVPCDYCSKRSYCSWRKHAGPQADSAEVPGSVEVGH